MSDFQDRVKTELNELSIKIEALDEFKKGDIFAGLPDEDQDLLGSQLTSMALYADLLEQRIDRF